MSTLAQTRVLSDPGVYVGGRLVAIIPNSVTEREPGEVSVRAVSAGGGAVQHVSGLNVEEMRGMVSFSIPTTGENVELAEGWRAASNAGTSTTVQVITQTRQSDYEDMWLTEAPEISYEPEGAIELTFEGSLPRRA
tara:strand:+ start:5674 stop:6081 length:408 start_codon:yes stop_codon:yes gene_type:complete